MYFVDKQIKEKAIKEELIISGYKEENVHCISYDLQIDCIIQDRTSPDEDNARELQRYDLRSGEMAFVKADVRLRLPLDCIGFVEERNSVIRMGLHVSGPCYQPGHESNVYLRVINLSPRNIILYKGQGIAQMMFYQLATQPDVPYSKEKNRAYDKEKGYRGVQGEWYTDWLRQIERYDQKRIDLENMESKIYGNIITIMGVFVAIFSMLLYSFNAASSKTNTAQIITVDSSLALLILVLSGILLLVINQKRSKSFYFVYFMIVAILLAVNILIWTSVISFA